MPKSATPRTRMMMPSLLSQFVPNVSSSAKTDFMRCCAVGFGEEERNAAICGGATTRAAAGGGTILGGGAGYGISAWGGTGVADAGVRSGSDPLVGTGGTAGFVADGGATEGGVIGFCSCAGTAAGFSSAC